MAEKILLTKEKEAEIKKELERLIHEERPKVIKAIQEAREQGDLSENADYDAAKNRQAEIEARIKEYENILNFAEIIDDKASKKSANKVKVGTKVKILDMSDDETYEYAIVGEVEADPDQDKISNVSPLAMAVLDHEEGEVVEIKGVEKPYKVKILKISRL
ncbi:MAG: transcription elongation factor GreA [Mycoplasmoidaceae bacterium]|nr:transcription elongation factor GreA [Mycoplasmoidaceae bacterium]